MGIKLILIIVLILLYFVMSTWKNGKKYYYFFTIIMLFSRRIDVPFFGAMTPSAVMIAVLFFTNINLLQKEIGRWIFFFIFMFLSVILGYANAYEPANVLPWTCNILVAVAMALIPSVLFSEENDLRIMIRCILAACVVYSITTIIGYYGYGDGLVIYNGYGFDLEDFHSSRIYGISDSNLVQVVSVISICLLPRADLKKRFIEWGILAIFVYSALITLKRMSFIAIIASMAYYFWYHKKHGNLVTRYLVIALVAAMASVFWDAISYRFGIAGFGSGEVDDSSSEIRIERMTMALNAFYASPIFGNGAGYYIYIHNGLMEILSNCGLIGIVLFFKHFLPKIKDVRLLNPWAVSLLFFFLTCFSLESGLNHAQTMAWLGVFLGGYQVSRKYRWTINNNI